METGKRRSSIKEGIMSTTTTNYGLKKPAADDYISPDDHNYNMDAIDTAMKNNANAAANAASAAEAANTAAGSASSLAGTKQNKATISEFTMLASGWSGTGYDFTDYPSASYNIEIQPNGDNMTDDQLKAWSKAKICGSYDANKAIAKGTVPTIDMPIILKVVNISA